METRLNHLRHLLTAHDLDAVLISSPANIVYFSGFSGFSSLERDGYLLVTKTAAYILTNPLYAEAAKAIAHLSLITYSASHPLLDQVKTLVHQHHLERIGFEADNLTVAEYDRFRSCFNDLNHLRLETLRVIKETREIMDIRNACQIADKALDSVIREIIPGMTEKNLVDMLEDTIRKSTSDVAFPTIVAFGQNAAIPHHKSDGTKLKKNDVILIDFGAVSHEYRSDMTRTFFIGKATDEQKKAYQAVLEAQKAAVMYIQNQCNYSSSEEAKRLSREVKRNSSRLAKARSNNKIVAAEVDRIARDSLLSQSYPSIPHSLGHGIGLAVHEAPALSPNSKDFLVEGMVFSIEPGVYFPGKFGIRIEDLYTIENSNIIRLTESPASFREL